ncbi:hypothetical protein TrispH2_012056 [Trichoplax sp. H2]|nr:hypothetical protein TrispH2_012056 [Trichoplax sp. H2]|eukprot:RDD35926.1 hypothetical protein TrispH2_012056 [Trichoplax sp. H2]
MSDPSTSKKTSCVKKESSANKDQDVVVERHSLARNKPEETISDFIKKITGYKNVSDTLNNILAYIEFLYREESALEFAESFRKQIHLCCQQKNENKLKDEIVNFRNTILKSLKRTPIDLEILIVKRRKDGDWNVQYAVVVSKTRSLSKFFKIG